MNNGLVDWIQIPNLAVLATDSSVPIAEQEVGFVIALLGAFLVGLGLGMIVQRSMSKES